MEPGTRPRQVQLGRRTTSVSGRTTSVSGRTTSVSGRSERRGPPAGELRGEYPRGYERTRETARESRSGRDRFDEQESRAGRDRYDGRDSYRRDR